MKGRGRKRSRGNKYSPPLWQKGRESESDGNQQPLPRLGPEGAISYPERAHNSELARWSLCKRDDLGICFYGRNEVQARQTTSLGYMDSKGWCTHFDGGPEPFRSA